ncbi:MAG: BNR repeat-containing protein [Bacteroidaceae bacterium]|nr:BNR repeat-containing protein [Bacteroidaceae bacterium]
MNQIVTKRIFLYVLVGFLTVCVSPAIAQSLLRVGDAWGSTSVNAAIFRNNSVVTHGRYQYVAYYDADGYLTLAKRRLGRNRWKVERSKYKGNCKDAHNVISLMVDGYGYLHVAFDHHNNPLRYVKSREPESLELGELQPMVGKGEKVVTYPEFYRLADGDLLFAYRQGGSGNGNLVMNRYDVESGQWLRVQDVLIDGERKRNAYWQLYVDEKGVIHLSWVWRETPDVATNHDLCYARSTDGGITWEKSTGEVYTLPITAKNAEYACLIPQKSELINQTSMTADAVGRPYIATYWRDADSEVPQYRLVWHDGKKWQSQQVADRKTPFSLSGGGTKCIPIARPRLVAREKKGKTEAYYIFRDVERGSRVSMAYTKDLTSGEWSVRDLTDFSVEAWEPSYDTELWKNRGKLDIYVQCVHQGDGEKVVSVKAQPLYVLRVKM